MRASMLVAALAITIGRPSVCTIANARLRRAASSSSKPTSTWMPLARSSSKPLPLTSGFGSAHRRHHAANAGGDDAPRAGPGAADVTARLERHI